MDRKHTHHDNSKRTLPNTPRVSDKIMEYYDKFGQDRDLEKFMRLYSPASSQDSQKAQRICGASIEVDSCCMSTQSGESISSMASCEALAKLASRPLSACCAINSKSLPNIDKQGQELIKGDFPAKDVIIDINIEMEGDIHKILSTSSENIQTPKKVVLRDIKTQTPDSVAKSHRRLEWDSLGDVGYKKSMSTSNISILERSLLKEFFKESSVTSEPCTSQQASEHAQHQKQILQKMVKCIKTTEIEHSTPPLACSTLVEGRKEKSTTREAKPKMITKSTSSTSLQEKFEKYAQTSLLKPPSVHSQEIQCTMSSSNSIIEGTATPSSFEYLSSRSSKSRSSKTSDYVAETHSRQQLNHTEHPFITSITDLLMKRKVLCEKNQQKRYQLDHIRELQTRFQAALEENKENQSHSTTASSTITSFSLTKQAPELDLGIQLICSLIDAKSVNGRQKKQLIRDIVKRITRLEAGASNHSSNSSAGGGATTLNSKESNGIKNKHIYDSINSNTNKSGLSEAGIVPISIGNASTSTSNTSSKPPRKFHDQPEKCNDNNLTCKMKQYEKVLKENNRKVSNVANGKTNKETQMEVVIEQQGNATKDTLRNTPTEVNYSTKSLANRSTQTLKTTSTTTDGTRSKTSTKSSSASSSSSTSTQDLTTQKLLATKKDLNNSNTDAEQATMREWLNPLTQSEIEYEEKKREETKKKAAAIQQAELRRENLLKKSSKHDCGRVQQLNWIDNEIHRLECLKHLLLKDETTTTERTSSIENVTKDSTRTDKLYDTVYSDKSSVLSESAEILVKEIEVILEESHEDITNLQDNLKRTKERKKETQFIYENPNTINNNNPKFRTMKETTTINEEQLLTDKYSEIPIHVRQPREKIDTPTSIENSQESESLKDLVQQRKREFMQAYKTKKQNHYAALKQQQKDEFEYLKTQKNANDEKFSSQTTSNSNSEHYSVPHTRTRKYAQQPLPLTPEEISKKSSSSSAHVVSSSTLASSLQQETNIQNKQKIKPERKHTTKTATMTKTKTTSTTSSSTSMFCISSDVSVPMGGSQLTSSTPTTTHHYDDVSAAVFDVAIQTSDSILLSKPIYGPQTTQLLHTKRLAAHFRPYATTTTTSSMACIQVKPKSIAYVIEFDNGPTTSSKSTSNLNLNNINSAQINPLNENIEPSTESNNSYISNNIKALLPSEPQLTLQDYLEKAKPEFLQHSKERKAILNQLQSMRQARDHKLREIVDNTSFNSLERNLKYLPPPPIQKVRILNTKEMKALTNKRFVNLPEVVARKERAKEEQYRRSNRILRDIFNRRLQKSVLRGKLSLNHSKTVI